MAKTSHAAILVGFQVAINRELPTTKSRPVSARIRDCLFVHERDGARTRSSIGRLNGSSTLRTMDGPALDGERRGRRSRAGQVMDT
jgi:hypothetical protein